MITPVMVNKENPMKQTKSLGKIHPQWLLLAICASLTLGACSEWSSVEDSASPFPSDYLLQVAVRRFEADYTVPGTAPTIAASTGTSAGPAALGIVPADLAIADLETDRKGLPILLRQYAKIGGKLLGFNVDPKFSDVLDGLIMVDLRETNRAVLERYMGKPDAAAFRRHHGLG